MLSTLRTSSVSHCTPSACRVDLRYIACDPYHCGFPRKKFISKTKIVPAPSCTCGLGGLHDGMPGVAIGAERGFQIAGGYEI